MTAKKAAAKRPPKALDVGELAVILAHADRHGDKATQKQFGISRRTLQRYREAIRAGRAPELAQLVTDQKKAALQRCSDLLSETYEMALKQLQTTLPSATVREAVGAVKILGELRLTSKGLGLDDKQPGDSGEGESPQADGGRDPGAPAAGPRGGASEIH